MRLSQAGGFMTAVAYPRLDSTLWRSLSRLPSLSHVLAFGSEDGYLAAVDTSGAPVRVDLRTGAMSVVRGRQLRAWSSVDGGAIYAITDEGEITRFMPAGGNWTFPPPLPADALAAQADGSLLVAGVQGDRVIVWRVRPPEQTVSDSISFDIGGDSVALRRTLATTTGAVGDRLFFGAQQLVIAVQARTMSRALQVDVDDRVVAITATPSGDRLFIGVAGDARVRIVDRFTEEISADVELPADVRALRMDPLGRVLLAQGPGDSVFVISLAAGTLQGVVRSAWRGDLPLVLPDGAIATARGADVIFADGATLSDARTVKDGAKQFWHVLRWNGFRQRAAGLDAPVEFRTSAPRDVADSVADDRATDTVFDSAAAARAAFAGRTPTADSSTASAPARAEAEYTLSFAAVLDEAAARTLARGIRVEGQTPRITTAELPGRTLYRVVLGPYASRREADRIGRLSGHSFLIFEGAP